ARVVGRFLPSGARKGGADTELGSRSTSGLRRRKRNERNASRVAKICGFVTVTMLLITVPLASLLVTSVVSLSTTTFRFSSVEINANKPAIFLGSQLFP